MRPSRQPAQRTNALLRQAIGQVFARPLLTGSLLLALAPASHGLTLGDISVRSTLGQRLDATVPLRLGAGESLASGCVVPGNQVSDLRTVPGVDIATPQAGREGLYALQVTSAAALYEPMYELELKVQCPGAPIVVRQYVLMLDLPAAVATSDTAAYEPEATAGAAPQPASPAPTANTAGEGISAAPGLAVPPPRTPRRGASSKPGETIEPGMRYRVADGDTLSSIAARVRSRQVSLWSLAAAIQAANPEAFIRNDPNLIKLGSEIVIPGSTVPPVAAGAAPESVPAPAEAPVPLAPPVPAMELAAPAQPAAAPAQPAVLPAAATGTPRPAAAKRAPAQRRTPGAVAASAPAVEDEPNPVVAAGAGIGFGLIVSALLWIRGRKTAAKASGKSSPAVARPKNAEPFAFATADLATAVTTAPVPLVTRALEPAFTVSYTPPADDELAAEFAAAGDFAGNDVTAELEEIFDSTDTTIQKRLNAEKLQAARSADTTSADDPVDPDATAQATAVDMRTLAAAATKDQQQAQTLLEALTLLERDYEEELTASQVLDMSAVREALANDVDEPTQIRDTQIRAASARKRAR